MHADSLFITGTDTDVGKTVVTAALAAAWPSRVRAVKPVASGIPQGNNGSDATRIALAAGHPPCIFQTWTAPVSPHRAALREGTPLNVPKLLSWLDSMTGPLLVEGAGGWKVPLSLDPRFDIADLAVHLGLPVVVVAANRLGVLNHTLLTVDAIRASGCEVAFVVLNTLDANDASLPTNLEDLTILLDVSVRAMPWIDPNDVGALASAGRQLLGL